jgi:hypothetical protein
MKYDVFLYEISILILIVAIFYMGFTLRKLLMIVKEKKLIWLLPMGAAAVLAVSLGAHVMANFKLLPELSSLFQQLSQPDVLADQTKSEAIKLAALSLKQSLTLLKTVSFGAFFLASLMLLLSTSVYLRMISK